MSDLTYGSLFSGIGGLDLAVEAVFGATCLWQCEIDPYARAVLKQRWPGIERFYDVRGLDNPTRVDLVCGGFPCQDVSDAGLQAGLEGQRSGLWGDFHRIIAAIRPRVVIVENVPRLRRRGFGRVLGDLAASGFDAEWGSYFAADAGAPLLRERLFMVAWSRGDGHALIRESRHRAKIQGWHIANGCHAYPPLRQAGSWGGWTGPLPGVRRDAYGVPRGLESRVRRERIKCLGNAVHVPQAILAISSLIARV